MKERIYLTDITLHARNRQTVNFSQSIQKGRIYSPLAKDYAQKLRASEPASGSSKVGEMDIVIRLPDDLVDRMERDEVEIMIPEDGLMVYASKDLENFISSKNGKRILRKLEKE